MNLRKRIFCFSSLLFLCARHFSFSQTDSSAKCVHFSVSAGLIINRTFSHFNTSNGYQMKYGDYLKYCETKNSKPYSPGLSLGITSVWGKSKRSNFIFGVSGSLTHAEYQQSKYTRISGYTPNTLVSYTTQSSNYKLVSNFFYLNFEAGIKFKVFGKLFLLPSLLLNASVFTEQTVTGTKITEHYSEYPSGQNTLPYYKRQIFTENIDTWSRFKDQGNGSCRLTAFYQFKLSNMLLEVYVFRNVSLTRFSMPWWGIGFSVNP